MKRVPEFKNIHLRCAHSLPLLKSACFVLPQPSLPLSRGEAALPSFRTRLSALGSAARKTGHLRLQQHTPSDFMSMPITALNHLETFHPLQTMQTVLSLIWVNELHFFLLVSRLRSYQRLCCHVFSSIAGRLTKNKVYTTAAMPAALWCTVPVWCDVVGVHTLIVVMYVYGAIMYTLFEVLPLYSKWLTLHL